MQKKKKKEFHKVMFPDENKVILLKEGSTD